MPDALPHFELYTDGACSGNPGPGGWAFILKGDGSVVEDSGGEPQTTNNRMELLSVINGLERIGGPAEVDLYSDSQYVVNGLNEWMDGWKKKGWRRGKNEAVKNVEMWQTLDELRNTHRIRAHWIRGHNDHPENERCDELAVAAIRQYRDAYEV